MAIETVKRFTETNKWDDPWFMELPPKYKVFWCYICDRCDCAGVWEPNMRLANARIGEEIDYSEMLRLFDKRVEQTANGKLWIRKFIYFQQGPELNPANNAHRGIIKRLEENNIPSPIPIKNKDSPCQGADMGLISPIGKGKGKGKEGESEGEQRPTTKFGLPLPPRCTIDRFGNVLDYTGRTMDINQVRKATQSMRGEG